MTLLFIINLENNHINYEARILKFHRPYRGIQRDRESGDRTKIVFERAAVSGGHKSVRLREQLLDGMQNARKVQQKKNLSLSNISKQRCQSLNKRRTLKSTAVILRYSKYLTNLLKLSMNLYRDMAPTRQVKCSWSHRTPRVQEQISGISRRRSNKRVGSNSSRATLQNYKSCKDDSVHPLSTFTSNGV